MTDRPRERTSESNDARIIRSWHDNVAPWTTAVRDHQIESRRVVTNAAIVDAVVARRPRTALDLGCGEGWLVRALSERGIRAVGVDAVPELIDRATLAGGGEFRVASYEMIVSGALDIAVDVAVANFSFIGHEPVDALIEFLPRLLAAGGSLIVQTLHPVIATGDLPYIDGWREGSWTGFSPDFTNPAPWYFRTLETWVRLFTASGFQLGEIREPLHPVSGKPASVIFIAEMPG